MPLRDGDVPLYFYELHESDSDIFDQVVLAHDTEYDEAEFLELVLEARARVIADFTQETLILAVADDLSTRAGFLVIDDAQLRVAVNVSAEDDGTFVAELDETARARGGGAEFRTVLVDIDPEDSLWGDDRPG